MNSERVSEKTPAIVIQLRRTIWQRLVDAFFGYDFRSSYAHADGKLYAEGIARQLKQHGFECFLDTKESFKGDDWQEIGYWALKSGNQIGNHIKQSAGIYGCLFNNSGTRFLTMSSDGTVNLWNGTNASAVGLSITNCGSMGGANFSPDGE